MNLNKNGKIAEFYSWSYGLDSVYDLPSSLCPFFWKSLMALLLFPLTWWTYVITFENRKNTFSKRVFSGLGFWGGATVIAGLLTIIISSNTLDSFLWNALLVILVLISLLLFIVFVCLGTYGTSVGIEYIKNNETYKEVKNIVSERKQGFFENYCPKINWK